MIIPRATLLSFNYTSFHTNGGDIVMQGHTGKVADFTTHFTFIINSFNTTPHADGMTFFLAHKDLPNIDEAKGGGLGLLRADQILNSTTFSFLAVEFDTFSNDFDPNYEHVGIDINSLESSAQVGWCNSVMTGKENEAWISYDSASNYLSVVFTGYCNNSNTKFRKYLEYQVDLTSILPENVAFGFSAATGIISMENVCRLRSSKEDHEEGSCNEEEETSCSDREEATDSATLILSNHHQVQRYDFHIVYSASFRVPVLYFRAYRSDGEPMVWEEIEKDLPACSSRVLLESKWTFITQEEHPYMNRPWYKLHPCGTSEWMKLLFLGDNSQAKHGVAIEQYLASWISVVGQAVGLRIPLEMLSNNNNNQL